MQKTNSLKTSCNYPALYYIDPKYDEVKIYEYIQAICEELFQSSALTPADTPFDSKLFDCDIIYKNITLINKDDKKENDLYKADLAEFIVKLTYYSNKLLEGFNGLIENDIENDINISVIDKMLMIAQPDNTDYTYDIPLCMKYNTLSKYLSCVNNYVTRKTPLSSSIKSEYKNVSSNLHKLHTYLLGLSSQINNKFILNYANIFNQYSTKIVGGYYYPKTGYSKKKYNLGLLHDSRFKTKTVKAKVTPFITKNLKVVATRGHHGAIKIGSSIDVVNGTIMYSDHSLRESMQYLIPNTDIKIQYKEHNVDKSTKVQIEHISVFSGIPIRNIYTNLDEKLMKVTSEFEELFGLSFFYTDRQLKDVYKERNIKTLTDNKYLNISKLFNAILSLPNKTSKSTRATTLEVNHYNVHRISATIDLLQDAIDNLYKIQGTIISLEYRIAMKELRQDNELNESKVNILTKELDDLHSLLDIERNVLAKTRLNLMTSAYGLPYCGYQVSTHYTNTKDVYVFNHAGKFLKQDFTPCSGESIALPDLDPYVSARITDMLDDERIIDVFKSTSLIQVQVELSERDKQVQLIDTRIGSITNHILSNVRTKVKGSEILAKLSSHNLDILLAPFIMGLKFKVNEVFWKNQENYNKIQQFKNIMEVAINKVLLDSNNPTNVYNLVSNLSKFKTCLSKYDTYLARQILRKAQDISTSSTPYNIVLEKYTTYIIDTVLPYFSDVLIIDSRVASIDAANIEFLIKSILKKKYTTQNIEIYKNIM